MRLIDSETLSLEVCLYSAHLHLFVSLCVNLRREVCDRSALRMTPLNLTNRDSLLVLVLIFMKKTQ